MRFPSFMLFSMLLISACTSSDTTSKIPTELAQEIVAKYSANPSLSYEMDYGIKFFSDPVDTSRASAKIDLIRDTSDAVFGGHIWLEQDSIVRYYDTDSLYFILKNQRTVTRYPSDESWVIKGNIIGEATSIYFLRPSRLVKGSMDSTNHTTLMMDSLNGRGYTPRPTSSTKTV